ncbi:hypothetical protein NP233_g2834 [Leucocoprinus birnbaumii]|uniref:UFSP1/2/DUB catalytic domain-containing protein n=1 Tax=Leucocoprinus birnbaumii TaxID=56174 RepID=A0AAD5VXK8_9AGAR|nr:hypothetical protein NP233_g2834 [Leucocoprinus birnbaumii]
MSDDLTCGFCSENLESLTLSQREDHYEAHFLETGCGTSAGSSLKPTSSQQNNPKITGQRWKKRSQPNARESWKKLVNKIENDVFWYPSIGGSPPRNYTPGLVPIIKRSLNLLCENKKITRAVLCHEKIVHISKELWDAPWGCGYRNFMMLCTGLVEQQHQPLYFPLLDAPPTPSVRNLQSWIQLAWNDGYDEIGRRELRNKIVGTNKWIGTAGTPYPVKHLKFRTNGPKRYMLLYPIGESRKKVPEVIKIHSWIIRAEVIDFNEFRDKESCAAAVIQWMVQYFTSDRPEYNKVQSASTSINDILGKTSPVVSTHLMPVILQHRGHSRLIVGYQQDVDGNVDLLTFDTGRLLPFALRSLGRSPYAPLEPDDASIVDLDASSSASAMNMQVHEAEAVNNNKRSITLADLLTPSEAALAKEQQLLPDGRQESEDRNKKPKLMSYFHMKKPKKDKSFRGFNFQNRKTEPDPRQVQRAFKLTSKQLAANIEYQVLYVPLRAPLNDREKLDRKVVKGRRITDYAAPSMEQERD